MDYWKLIEAATAEMLWDCRMKQSERDFDEFMNLMDSTLLEIEAMKKANALNCEFRALAN